MNKIAIIIEDMRFGGPQKQLIYFFKTSYRKKNHKYLIIAPRNSKKNFQNF